MDARALLRRAADEPGLVVGGPVGPAPRVALLPASFDPMTVGHAALADAALGEGSAVVLLYSVRTLEKEGDAGPPLLGQEARVASVGAFAATRSGAAVAVTTASLLVEQAEAAAAAFPGAAVEVLAGSDKVLQVLDPRWYPEPVERALSRLFAVATVRFAVRAGDEGRVEATVGPWAGRIRPIAVDPGVAGVSSRRVRELLRSGDDVSGLVPPEVMPFLPAPG